jgi:hypothetical protein
LLPDGGTGGVMVGEDRRRRILAEIGSPDAVVRVNDVAQGICRFAVDRLAASGCAVTLMAQPSVIDVLATAGRQAAEIADLQFTLGEGPCLDAFASGSAVLAGDLAGSGTRWPMFSAAAVDLGVLAEFSLPMQVGAAAVGTLDLSRHEAVMLSDDDLASAFAAAEIVTDAVLSLQGTPDGVELSTLLEPSGTDRLVVHQACGMVSVQLDVSIADALATLRAAAFRSGRPINEVAIDVVGRRLDFRE